MIKVALEGAEFFAYHGFYDEEQLIGTRFLVDIEVSFDSQSGVQDDDLINTVNYEQLYDIAKAEMREPKKLLETVAQNILGSITGQFTYIKNATVTLRKLNPPLGGPVKASAITVTYPKENK